MLSDHFRRFFFFFRYDAACLIFAAFIAAPGVSIFSPPFRRLRELRATPDDCLPSAMMLMPRLDATLYTTE